jgi:hypothetical protein
MPDSGESDARLASSAHTYRLLIFKDRIAKKAANFFCFFRAPHQRGGELWNAIRQPSSTFGKLFFGGPRGDVEAAGGPPPPHRRSARQARSGKPWRPRSVFKKNAALCARHADAGPYALARGLTVSDQSSTSVAGCRQRSGGAPRTWSGTDEELNVAADERQRLRIGAHSFAAATTRSGLPLRFG